MKAALERYKQLIQKLIDTGYLSTPEIIEAFKTTTRRNYLPKSHQLLHCINSPVPIGEGQTNSQPLTVAFMLELLQPKPGHKILEIGYGSGWQTAILAKLICPELNTKKCGKIYAYEIIPKIAEFGSRNLAETLTSKHRKIVNLYSTDYSDSYSKHQPYHRIIAAASFTEKPLDLVKSLKIGGVMIFPTEENDIRKVTRKSKLKYEEEVFPGFRFVPITH